MTANGPVPISEDLTDRWLRMILALAAGMIFYGLGDRTLWQDEGETAVYARSILRHGVPKGFDGVNWTTQVSGQNLAADGTVKPYYSPWLPFYVSAAGIAVFGETDLGPRAPFAVFGWLTVWMTYRLSRRLGMSLVSARLSALALTLSVPFLLQARQARGYALVMFLTLVWIGYLLRSGRAGLAGGLVSGILLAYSNHVFFAGAVLAVGAGLCVLDLRRERLFQLLKILVGILPFLAPLLLGFVREMDAFRLGPAFSAGLTLTSWISGAETYIRYLTLFALPVYGLLVLCVPPIHRPAGFLAVVLLTYVAFVSLFYPKLFRYLMPVIPVSMMLVGLLCERIWTWKKPAGILCSILLIGTNIFHLYPLRWWTGLDRVHPYAPPPAGVGVPVLNFIRERLTPVRDPNSESVRFFKSVGLPGQVVLATYGDLPLQYHTPLRVLGGNQGRPLEEHERPEWIMLSLTDGSAESLRIIHHVSNRIDLKNYVCIFLPVVNTMFGNIPDPDFHFFRTASKGLLLPVFARKDIYEQNRDRLAAYQVFVDREH